VRARGGGGQAQLCDSPLSKREEPNPIMRQVSVCTKSRVRINTGRIMSQTPWDPFSFPSSCACACVCVRMLGRKQRLSTSNWIFILAAKSGLAMTQSEHLIGSHLHTFRDFNWTGLDATEARQRERLIKNLCPSPSLSPSPPRIYLFISGQHHKFKEYRAANMRPTLLQGHVRNPFHSQSRRLSDIFLRSGL
jgi:hypothetical protein